MTAVSVREPTSSMQVLRGLLHILSLEGVSQEDVLAGEELDLDARDARLPLSALERIYERALRVTGEPALGLHWVERMSHHTFGPISMLTSNANNLRDALALVTRFGTLFTDQPFLEILEHEDHITLRALGFHDRSAAVRRFAAEMTVGGTLRMIRSMWEDARPERIFFDFEAPPYAQEYARVLGQAPQFGAPNTGMELSRALVDARSPHFDRELNATLTVLAEKRLRHVGAAQTYATRVRGLLVARAPMRLKMSAVARALGLSVRSLRRRLTDEGTSYGEVEAEALASVASQLLQEERHSIKEVAHRMGFSDAATFHRAFKRWTGATPSSYQEPGHARLGT